MESFRTHSKNLELSKFQWNFFFYGSMAIKFVNYVIWISLVINQKISKEIELSLTIVKDQVQHYLFSNMYLFLVLNTNHLIVIITES